MAGVLAAHLYATDGSGGGGLCYPSKAQRVSKRCAAISREESLKKKKLKNARYLNPRRLPSRRADEVLLQVRAEIASLLFSSVSRFWFFLPKMLSKETSVASSQLRHSRDRSCSSHPTAGIASRSPFFHWHAVLCFVILAQGQKKLTFHRSSKVVPADFFLSTCLIILRFHVSSSLKHLDVTGYKVQRHKGAHTPTCMYIQLAKRCIVELSGEVVALVKSVPGAHKAGLDVARQFCRPPPSRHSNLIPMACL